MDHLLFPTAVDLLTVGKGSLSILDNLAICVFTHTVSFGVNGKPSASVTASTVPLLLLQRYPTKTTQSVAYAFRINHC